MTDKHPIAGKILFINSLWTVTTRIAIRLIGAISVVILARLLTPDDYGIVAQAVMVMSFLMSLTALGLYPALIANQNAEKEHYNTVWTIHILQALLISVVLAALAIPASVYFREPEIEFIIYIYAALTFVGGFVNVGIVDFRKHLKFHLDFRYNLYGKISAFLTTIIIAFLYQSYWALVSGVAMATVVELVLSYTMSPYRPSFCLSKWRELFHFSKWMMIHEFTTSMAYEVDSFILARFSTARSLGVYVVASELAETPTSELAMSVSRAATPSYAKLNDDVAKLKLLYQKSLGLMVLVAAPAGVGISVLSQELTNLVLGAKWVEAAPFIEILALTGIFTLFTANSISALISSGNIRVLALLSTTRMIVRTAILIAGFYIGGVYGLVVATLVAVIVYVIISLSTQRYFNLISFRKLLSLCWRSIVSTVGMYFGLKEFQLYINSSTDFSDAISMILIIIIGALIYGASLLILWALCGKCDGPEREIITFIKRS